MAEFGGGDGSGPTMTIKVFHGSNQYDLTIPSQATFGDLKRVISQETGSESKVLNLLFRGKEKEDNEYLHMAGLKDNAKVVVMEDSAVEEKFENVKGETELSKGSEAVAEVREEIDKLANEVAILESTIMGGLQAADKDILFVTEMLMRQLLKLDGIDAEGDGRVQRKAEVRRVQSLVETMDNLKVKNSNTASSIINGEVNATSSNNGSVPVAAQNKSDVGNSNVPHSLPSSTRVTQEWEVFD